MMPIDTGGSRGKDMKWSA